MNKSVLSNHTFYSEDDDRNKVNFTGESLKFTPFLMETEIKTGVKTTKKV